MIVTGKGNNLWSVILAQSLFQSKGEQKLRHFMPLLTMLISLTSCWAKDFKEIRQYRCNKVFGCACVQELWLASLSFLSFLKVGCQLKTLKERAGYMTRAFFFTFWLPITNPNTYRLCLSLSTLFLFVCLLLFKNLPMENLGSFPRGNIPDKNKILNMSWKFQDFKNKGYTKMRILTIN